MTETALNERLSELAVSPPPESRRAVRREMRIRKNDRLMRIVRGRYMPYAGYVDRHFAGDTLYHSGFYIRYPKNSRCRRWLKRQAAKSVRRCPYPLGKGGEYRRLFDYWWSLY